MRDALRRARQGLRRFRTATWTVKGPILAIVGCIVLATVLSILLTLVLRISPAISNEGWVAIATAVYAAATVLVLAVLALAAWYAKGQLHVAEKSRLLSALDRLSLQWESDLLREARRLANKSGKQNLRRDLADYDSRNAEELYTLSALPNFFEEIGILIGEGQLSAKHVADRFRPSILYYYDLFSEDIAAKQKEDEEHLVHFQKLATAMSLGLFCRRLYGITSSYQP